MRNLLSQFHFLGITCMLLSLSMGFLSFKTLAFENHNLEEDHFLALIVGDNLVGGWEYTATGAPDGYDKGFLMIVGERGNYTVRVQVEAGIFIGKNITVKKNVITFTLDIGGSNVSLTLKATGSSISGTSHSSYGEYPINGVKTLSQG
ncbi:MAG: hypothetical protein AAFX53_04825 [Bacteroidota bacterium]